MARSSAARVDEPRQDWLAQSLAEKMPEELEAAPSESVLPDREAEKTVVYEEVIRPSRRVNGVLAGLFTFLFVFGFLGACLFQTYTLKQEYDELEAQKISLEAQIEEAKKEALLNKIDQSYFSSDKYREDMARNRFRLIFPGEYLVQIE